MANMNGVLAMSGRLLSKTSTSANPPAKMMTMNGALVMRMSRMSRMSTTTTTSLMQMPQRIPQEKPQHQTLPQPLVATAELSPFPLHTPKWPFVPAQGRRYQLDQSPSLFVHHRSRIGYRLTMSTSQRTHGFAQCTCYMSPRGPTRCHAEKRNMFMFCALWKNFWRKEVGGAYVSAKLFLFSLRYLRVYRHSRSSRYRKDRHCTCRCA